MESGSVLVTAIVRILTPLVKILLRYGVSYGSFAELAKKVFVKVALNEFVIEGRKQSISRVSVITGLNRKEVKRQIQNSTGQVDDIYDERYNRAARVISGWRRESAQMHEKGSPPQLPLGGKGPTFTSLVKRYSGDMPVRAVLDELVRVGAVSRTQDGAVRLQARSYLPKNDENMKLNILGVDVGHLISTIDYNLEAGAEEARLQRKVCYDNLPREVLPLFQKKSKEKAQELIDYIDQYLSRVDRDTDVDVQGTGRYRAGIGIFYFEEPVNDESE